MYIAIPRAIMGKVIVVLLCVGMNYSIISTVKKNLYTQIVCATSYPTIPPLLPVSP